MGMDEYVWGGGPNLCVPAYACSHFGCLCTLQGPVFHERGIGLFWALGEIEGQVTWLERVKEMAQTCYRHFRLEAPDCGSRAPLTACSPGHEQGLGHLPGCLPAGLAPGDPTQGWLPTLHSRPYHHLTDSGYHRAGWAEDLQKEASGNRKIGQG